MKRIFSVNSNIRAFFFKWGRERRWGGGKGSNETKDGDRESDRSKVNLLPAWWDIYYQGKGSVACDPGKVLCCYRWHPKL